MDMKFKKIAICIPTFCKDGVFMDTINSILDIYKDNWVILIGDQNRKEDWSFEKTAFYHSACAEAHKSLRNQDRIKVHALPYDCGLSRARNELVQLADHLGIKYCLMSADSIRFTESMKNINYLLKYLNHSKGFNIDLLGLQLFGRVGWEANLELKNSQFELDFIDTSKKCGLLDRYCDNSLTIYNCEIVRNFFLATTKSLLNVPWDNKGKMSEHTPYFWEYKKAGYKVGWTEFCEGQYTSFKNKQYNEIRSKNLHEGKAYFKEKYNLNNWTKYFNVHNIHKTHKPKGE